MDTSSCLLCGSTAVVPPNASTLLLAGVQGRKELRSPARSPSGPPPGLESIDGIVPSGGNRYRYEGRSTG